MLQTTSTARMPSWRSACAILLASAGLASCGGGSSDSMNAAAPAAKFLTASTVVTGSQNFAGPRDRYTIVRTATGWTVNDRFGGSPTTLGNLAALVFPDATVNLGIGDLSKTIDAAEMQNLVELYIAFFNRVPDADGLAFWINQRKAGQSLDDIANSFYGAAVSAQFSALTGYSATMDNNAFVTIVYKNVLGRDPDQTGLNFWVALLTSPTQGQTRGQLVRSMLAAAHTFKGDPSFGFVADLLDNRYAVGRYYAIQQGLTFTSDAYNFSKTISLAVTPTSTAAALAQFSLTDSSFSLLVPAPPIVTPPTPTVPSFATVQAIIQQRCVSCHSNSLQNGGYSFSTANQIRSNVGLIYSVSVLSTIMPDQNNSTGMTADERSTIGAWVEGGAP